MRRNASTRVLVLGRLLLFCVAIAGTSGQPFYLKDADRIVFYADSITQQRFYANFIETYTVTLYASLATLLPTSRRSLR